jgi:hypothetical protein
MAEQTDSALVPNTHDMRAHLDFLFGAAREYDDGLIEIAAGKDGKWHSRLFGIDQIDEAVAYAAQENARGWNVYTGQALRDPDSPPFGRSSDADHYATTAAYVDLDTSEAAAAAPDRTASMRPHLAVCTGVHPHRRMQLHWLLDEPLTDKDAHRAVCEGLADSLGGDRHVCNPGRILRLAGSIAWPTKPGRVAEMTFLMNLKEVPPPVSIVQLQRQYPRAANATTIDTGKNTPIERQGAGLLGLGGEVVTDGRHAYMRGTILAVFGELVGTTGAAPAEQELFDAAWPQYEAHTDLSRPGRGPDVFARMCASTVRRFEQGRLRGRHGKILTLDGLAEEWQQREAGKKMPEHKHRPEPVKPIGALFTRAKFFAANWVPAEYLVDGIIQRGYCYSLTAPTGGGKTAVILNLAACVGSGRDFAGAETLPGRVGYFAAENPNDIQARWKGLEEAMQLDDPDVYFCPYTIDLSAAFEDIKTEVEAAGGFDLIIVDTSQAFFGGDDENSNSQMVNHAKAMRKLTTLPGNPCVIILTHPVKNPSKDNLLPRGGGGFLAEVDGNLTIWNDSDNITLHHQGKFRGAGFAPINFVLKGVNPKALKDAKGRQIPTVVAEHVSEEAFRKRLADNATDEDKVMIMLLSRKGDISFADIATANQWVTPLGAPLKSKVSRLVESLKKQKLIAQRRTGKLSLTAAGKAEIGKKARALGIDGAGQDDTDDFDIGAELTAKKWNAGVER